MNDAIWMFDALLAAALLWSAARVLATPRRFEAVVLFVAFGLLMALCWMRLGAPDVALAEAAIGAGLTGALLFSALARLEASDPDRESSNK
jgi:energy-converting hydrogenase B subunit D